MGVMRNLGDTPAHRDAGRSAAPVAGRPGWGAPAGLILGAVVWTLPGLVQATPKPAAKPAPAAKAAAQAPGAAKAAAQAPAAQAPAAPKPSPKPAVRDWVVKHGRHRFALSFSPGIADPGQLTELRINASSVPKTADPRFGRELPVKDAKLTVTLSSPEGAALSRHRVHRLPLSVGRYGLHLRPPKAAGLYKLTITGQTAEGEALPPVELRWPVGVWPLPKELQGSGAKGSPRVRRVIRKPLGG